MSSEGRGTFTETPSRLWYVAHVFFWIISGIICYIVWKERNREAARRHLIHSLWLPFVVYGIATVIMILAFPEEW